MPTGLELLLGKLTPAIARAIVKSWAGDHELLLDTTSGLADLFGKAGLGLIERRKAARELDAIGEEIAQRLHGFFAAERPGGLENSEAAAAILAVSDTIDVGFTEASVAFEVNMDPEALEKRLRSRTQAVRDTAHLSEIGQRLYDFTLRQSCVYLVQMMAEMTGFGPAALVELLQRSSRLEDLLREALAALPEPDRIRARDFATSYRQAIARKLDWVDLLGLNASRSSRRYALSIAYVGLRADLDEDLWDYDEMEVAEDPDRVRRADELAGEHMALVVSGIAGSGKTTILQWLAVRSATRSFRGDLTDLNDLMPFYVRLRRYAGAALPRPAEFVRDVAEPIAETMPAGWVEERFSRGEALVLIDGIDEIPAAQRAEASEWLQDLYGAYPDCRYVVSTRPGALADWEAPDHFALARLQPMSMRDIDHFVEHWYRAAAHGEPNIEARAALPVMAEQLKTAFREQSPIRRLASNPLMCAVICAVHRDGNAVVPKTRVALYETALHLLLETRDAARKIATPEVDLTGQQKRLLVEELAWWMVSNDLVDAAREEVEARVEEMTTRMDLGASPTIVVQHLIDRTGLLREPARGRVDFVHKSFLEYLGARRAASRNDVGLLIKNAHEVAFQEVVVLAAASATPKQRDILIERILARSTEEPRYKHRLAVVAAQCVDVAPDLDPGLRQRVDSRLEALLPPADITTAEALAEAGDVVVDMLPYRETLSAEEARACVRALARIGSPAALTRLHAYARDHRLAVMRELVAAWDLFDRDQFAEEVMIDAPLAHGSLTVVDAESLRFLRHLRGLRRLRIESSGTQDYAGLIRAAPVEELDIDGADGLHDLSQLVPLHNLRSLRIRNAPHLESLAGLEDLRLQELSVSDARGLQSAAALERSASQLVVLHLHNTGLSQLDVVTSQRGLQDLSFAGDHLVSLQPIEDLSHLRRLTLSVSNDLLDLHWLALAPSLTELSLRRCRGDLSADELPQGSGLGIRRVEITRCLRISSVRALSFCHGATELILSGLKLASLEGLGEAVGPDLKRLVLHDCKVTSLSGIPRTLTSLRLDSLPVRDLRPLRDLPELQELEIDDIPIAGFRTLADCHALTRLVIGEMPRIERVTGLRQVTSLRSIDPGPFDRRIAALALPVELEQTRRSTASSTDRLILGHRG